MATLATTPTDTRPHRVHALLLAATAAALLMLPFVTSIDDLLTQAGLYFGFAQPIQALAPAVGHIVVHLLALVGQGATSQGGWILLSNSVGPPTALFLSWNCLGWQSILLLGLSLVGGLSGKYPLESRLQTIILGLLGTVLINLLRITVVCLMAARLGYAPAILFHDYGGTLLTLVWLIVFWGLAYRFVLPAARSATQS